MLLSNFKIKPFAFNSVNQVLPHFKKSKIHIKPFYKMDIKYCINITNFKFLYIQMLNKTQRFLYSS
jgi:hypothetical protein